VAIFHVFYAASNELACLDWTFYFSGPVIAALKLALQAALYSSITDRSIGKSF